MCDYCREEDFSHPLTGADERLQERLARFVAELRKHSQQKWYCYSVADVLEGIIGCEGETVIGEEVEEVRIEMETDKRLKLLQDAEFGAQELEKERNDVN